MNKPIVSAIQDAYEQITNDTKFVRLTTVTTIVHSMAFLVYIAYSAYLVFEKTQGNSSSMGDLVQGIMQVFEAHGIVGRGIGLGVILLIGYFMMPPIGEASLICYLSAEEKRGSVSLGRGFAKFFPMFEYNGMVSFFGLLPFFMVISRFRVLGMLNNFFIIIFLGLWAVVILFASLFLPYARFYIVLEDLPPFEAMKKSMSTSLEHFSLTSRGAMLQYALSARFIINMLVFLGLPLLIIYIASAFDVTQSGPIASLLVVVSVSIGLLIAYVNGIIEAFFITLRYRLFQQIR